MNSETGKWIMVAGLLLLIAGMLIFFFHDKLNWIGRLPGDINIKKEHFRFYFPVTTMIIFSVLLTLIVGLIKKILQ